MPTFESPMITRCVANVLCMHTVLRVLPCYRIVLPCYRCSVTEVLNNSSGFCIGVFQFENRVYRVCDWLFWLLAACHPFTLAPWICSRLSSRMGACTLAYALVCVRLCVRVRACAHVMRDPKKQGGFRLIYGGARARELFTVVAPQICSRSN